MTNDGSGSVRSLPRPSSMRELRALPRRRYAPRSLLLAAGAPALARSAWPDRAPRLAIAIWLALAASAIASVMLTGVALMVPTERVSGGIAWLLAACQMALRAPTWNVEAPDQLP